MNLKRTKKVIIFQRRSTRRFFIFNLLFVGVFSLFFSAPPVAAVEGLMNGKLLTGETDNYLLWLQTYDRNTAPYFSDRLFMDKSGNLGIGLTNPTAKLDIVGANSGSGLNLRTLGDVMIGNSAGAGIFFDGNYSYASGNYIKSVASNVQGFFTAGAERMRILANGYIGIGTTSPASTLDVNGLIKMRVVNITQPEDVINKAYLDSVVAGTTTVPTVGYWTKLNNDIYSANSGNVGIGTTSPSEKLDIAGNINLYGASRYIKFPDNTIFDFSGSNKLYITTGGSGGAARLVIDNANGNIGIGTTNPTAKLEVKSSGSGHVIQATASDGSNLGSFYEMGGGYGAVLIKDNAGVTKTTFPTDGTASYIMSGNVGIGTTAPKNKLDVAGGMALGSYAGVNTAPSNSLIVSGNIGINSTTPNYRLSISSSTADVINVGGGFVAGLNSTPVNPDQAVPLIYLQNNYAPLGTGAGSAFVQKGNSFGEAAILGTNDNYNLNFETNNTSRLTIDTAGNVGIGTTAPNANLQLGSSSGDQILKLGQTYAVGIKSTHVSNVGQRMDLGYYHNSNTFVPALSMQAASGNVGIGITNPGAKLEVAGQTKISALGTAGGSSDNLLISNTYQAASARLASVGFYLPDDPVSTTNRRAYIGYGYNDFTAAYATWNYIFKGLGIAAAKGGIHLASEGYDTDFITVAGSSVPSVTFKASGSVGIGSTTPNIKLSVSNGSTGNVIDVGGANIGGLASTPTNPDQAVPLGYLQNNYNATSTSLWSGSLAGNISNANSGNVGIGTATPAQKLHVVGNSYFNGNVGVGTTNPVDKLTINTAVDNSAIGSANISFVYGSGASFVNSITNIFSSGTTIHSMNFNTVSSGVAKTPLSLLGNGNAIFNAGNVGIGTTNPLKRLTISADSDGDGLIIKRNSAGAGTYADLGFTMTTTDIAPTTYLRAYRRTSYSDNDLLFHVGTSDAMYIKSNGNVGIGTTAPGAKLEVEGTDGIGILIKSALNDATFALDSGTGVGDFPGIDFYKGGVLKNRIYTNQQTSEDLYISTTNGGGNLIIPSGSVGIGSTTPNIKLSVSNGSTGNVIDVGGANIGGLASTPTNPDQAVPLGYLQNNYNATSTSLWSGSLAGNISNANSGNVGIGTSSPTEKLEVNGKIKFGNNTISGETVTFDGSYSGVGMRLQNTNGYITLTPLNSGWAHIYTDRPAFIFNAPVYTTTGKFSAYNIYNLELQTAGVTRLLIATSTGNVGIGTTAPQAKAHILGTTDRNVIMIQRDHGYGNDAFIRFTNSSNPLAYSSYIGSTRNTIDNNGSGDLVFGTNNNNILTDSAIERMRITNSGNVGIGSTTPNIKLSVSNGSTGNVIDVGGANIGGLASTPTNPDQAVPLIYLQNNYNATSTSFWSGSLAGNISNANSGNVGIGITNPGAKLEVAGQTKISALGTAGGSSDNLLISNTYQAASARLASVGFYLPDDPVSTTNRRAYIGYGYNDFTAAYATWNYIFKGLGIAAAKGGIHLASEGYDTDFITVAGSSVPSVTFKASGSVGIGTTNPGSTLTIAKNGGDNTTGLRLTNASGTHYGSMYFIPVGTGATDGFYVQATREDAPLQLGTGTYPQTATMKGGNVGIGSTTPNIKLSVSNGSTGNVIDVGGANIGGLASTPTNPDQAVPLGYLQNNYNATSTSLWSGSLAGNISNANSGNVGIGTTNPAYGLTVSPSSTNATALFQDKNITKVIVQSGINQSNGNMMEWRAYNGTVGAYVNQDGYFRSANIAGTGGTGPSLVTLGNGVNISSAIAGNVPLTINNSAGATADLFRVQSSGSSLFVINNAGNVGIGTTTPGAYKLFVNGDTNIVGNLNVTGTTTAGAFVGTVAGTTYAANIFNGAFGSNTGNGDYGFPNRLSLNFGSGTTPLTLNQSAGTALAVSGNLGIGTTTAVSLLHLYDPTAGPIITLSGLITNYRGLTIKDIAGAEQWFYGLNNNNNFVVRRSGTSDYLTVASSTGYVGIGTTAPNGQLDVYRKTAWGDVAFRVNLPNVNANRYLQVSADSGGTMIFEAKALSNDSAQNLLINPTGGTVGIGYTAVGTGALNINGNVGIGTTSPLARLHVIGDAIVTGTMQTQTGSDFAEEFSVAKNLPAGTVVVMADSGHKSVRESDKEYDKTVVGIVSDNPSIIAGRVDSKQKVVVAMMGVVSVNVNNTNGQIEKGDLLTTSASRGYAMKAVEFRPGTIIGKALENLSGRKGKIKVLVNLQ